MTAVPICLLPIDYHDLHRGWVLVPAARGFAGIPVDGAACILSKTRLFGRVDPREAGSEIGTVRKKVRVYGLYNGQKGQPWP